MSLNTAAAVVNYITEMESACAAFYEKAGKGLGDPFFLGLAKENRRFQKRVVSAYRSSVTDILETGFGFSNITESVVLPDPAALSSSAKALGAALELEKSAADFYAKAADSCAGLLDDVARALGNIAKKRGKRAAEIQRRV